MNEAASLGFSGLWESRKEVGAWWLRISIRGGGHQILNEIQSRVPIKESCRRAVCLVQIKEELSCPSEGTDIGESIEGNEETEGGQHMLKACGEARLDSWLGFKTERYL